MKMNQGVAKQKAHHSKEAMVRFFLIMWKLHPKFGVTVNTVQVKKMSASVIFLDFQILVVMGIPNDR